jgi:hypothetical protein
MTKRVFLVSFPKSGNTWLRFLLVNYFYGSNNINFTNINKFSLSGIENSNNAFDGPVKFIKLHKSFDQLGDLCVKKDDVFILLYRNPCKVLSSYYHFKKAQEPDFFSNPTRFLDVYDEQWKSWGEHFQSWLNMKGKINISYHSYEDLMKNPAEVMFETIKAIGCEPDLSKIATAVKRSDLNNMKAMSGQQEFMKSRKKEYRFVRNKQLDLNESAIVQSLSHCKASISLANQFYNYNWNYSDEKNYFRKIANRVQLKILRKLRFFMRQD